MIMDQQLNWALESFDFSSLEDDFSKEPVPSMLTSCGTRHTLSTVGSGSSLTESWGYDSDSVAEYEFFQQSILAKEATIPEVDEGSIDLEASESSLDLSDLKAFAQEDEVGIYDPERRDELPPPRVRVSYKGDSQHSFTLEDLEQIPKDNASQRISSDTNNEESLSLLNEDSMQQKESPLKGILKNGISKKEKRSSSLAIQQMERSSMLNLSLGDGSLLFEDSEDDEDEESCSSSINQQNGWAMMQQSFAMEDIGALDLQALEEKSVSFGSVCVHEHPIIAGNNPSVSEGVPLSLAWQAQSSHTFSSLEVYEKSRSKRRPARKIEAEERMWMLMNAGVSLKAIQHAEMMTNIARDEREATKQQHLLLLAGQAATFCRAIRVKEEEEEQWKGRKRRGRTLSRLPPRQEQDEPRRVLVVSPERGDAPTTTAHSA